MHKFRRKYHYREHVINDGYFKKLYGIYMDKPIYNKILDKLVFLAMLTIIITVVVHFFVIPVPSLLFWILEVPSFLILFVFVLELVRMYMQTSTRKEFIQKHWIDFILISFLSFYFVFVGMAGLLKIKLMEMASPILHEAKNARIFFKFFRGE